MLEELRDDFLRVANDERLGVRRTLHLLFNQASLQAIVAYRLGQWLRTDGKRPSRWPVAAVALPAYALLTGFVRLTLDIHLDSTAEIGPGLLVYHFGGIRFSHCRVGKDCVIHQEVRLEPDAEGRGPQLGDRVWVGPHARFVGPVRIGNGATIGAGAVVRSDVPENTIVVGNPARIVRVSYDNAELRGRE
jgi:serine O-acetyltransferase